jgi:hypothetical protein
MYKYQASEDVICTQIKQEKPNKPLGTLMGSCKILKLISEKRGMNW